jgi:hypothetical protein
MKKLLVATFMFASFVSYGQNYKSKVTIGGMSGVTFGGSLNANYGGWVEIGNFGVQYLYGVRASNDNAMNYINGKTNSYTAGSTYNNIALYGALPKFDNTDLNIIMGGGVQSSTDITTEGFKNDTSPLFVVGLQTDLGYFKQYTIRTDVSISQIMSLNIGFGIKL